MARSKDKPWKPFSDRDVFDILDDVGKHSNGLHLEAEVRGELRDGINQDIERRNQLRAAQQTHLPGVHIEQLTRLQDALERVYSELDAIRIGSYVSYEIACAADWIEAHWPTGQIKVRYGATQLAQPIPHRPDRNHHTPAHEEYLVDRTKMWLPTPSAMLTVRLDQDRVARIHLAATLAKAREDRLKNPGKKPYAVRHIFVRNLAVRYERAFGEIPKTTADGHWIRFLSAIMSRLEAKPKQMPLPTARDLWKKAGAAGLYTQSKSVFEIGFRPYKKKHNPV